ncbi:MAG TPA: HupE/UreJ family protein [Planctomycetota bacterium]|nr:HupE/UreJ family protein [Planctomycetota bacterium]
MKFLVLAIAVGAPAPRHDDRVSASKLTVSGRDVTWEVDVSRTMMEDVVKFPSDAVDLTEAELQTVKDPIARYLESCLAVRINGKHVPAEIAQLAPETAPFVASGQLYIYRMHQTFRFRSDEPVRSLELDLRFFADRMVGHGTVVTVEWEGAVKEYRRITPASLLVTYRELHPTILGTAGDALLAGLRAFLGSPAAVAVVLAFLLAAPRAAEGLKVAVSFAAAQGVVAIVAGRGSIQFGPGTLGSLAAATVLYVALENLWLGEARHRWILAFGLGLVHGAKFGQDFAGSRRALEENPMTALAGFDAGLALGTAAVLLVALPALGWLRGGGGDARPRRVLRVGSVALAVLGATLLFERLAGVSVLPAWMSG